MASQTIVGPDLQFTQDNKRCFAYSGTIAIADTAEHTALEFTTGSYYCVMDVIFWRRSWESDDAAFYIEFNGQQVLSWIGGSNPPGGSEKKPLIIPPSTAVAVYIDKQQHSADSLLGVNMTGRVYEYLPVRN